MMKRLAMAVSAVGCLAAAGCGSGVDPVGFRLEDRNRDGEVRFLAFGDSLTEGRGDGPSAASLPPNGGYPARLETLTGVTVVNAGLGGETTDAGRARLPGVLAQVAPDAVLLLEGVNDLDDPGRSDFAIFADLRAMLDAIEASGATPVLATIPPSCCTPRRLVVQRRIHAANVGIRDLGRERDVAVLDFAAAFGEPYRRERGLVHESDGLHPTPRGYDRMAAAALARLF